MRQLYVSRRRKEKKKIIQGENKQREREKGKNWVQHIDMATLEWVLGHARC